MRRLWSGLLVMLLTLPAWGMAPIQQWETSNGARVYFVAAPELPMLDAEVMFAAGAVRDGHTPGLAMLTANVLDEGSAAHAPDEFHAALDNVGALLSSSSGRDASQLMLRTLVEPAQLEQALSLFCEVLRAPRFEAQVLERQRRMLLSALAQNRGRPEFFVQRAFRSAVYGEHPYAEPVAGTPEAVSKLTLAQVKAFHARYYVARNAMIVLVGDLDRAGATRIAERLSSMLPAGERAPLPPEVPSAASAVTRDIEFDSAQTHVLMGQLGIARGDPDYFPLLLGNHVLGGNGVVTRLFNEVREKRGLSYSVESHFEQLQRPGPFVVTLQTRTDKTAEAVALVKAELTRFITEGPTADELEEARRNLLGGFPLRIDNNAKILENVANIAFYGLPLDYLETYPRRVQAVTLEEVKQALRRRLDPARMSVITAGRRSPVTNAP